MRVLLNGVEVAGTGRALTMAEGKYPDVFYIPFDDCHRELFIKTDHTTFCPFKGTASYWTLQVVRQPGDAGGEAIGRAQNAVWGYEVPYDEVAAIGGHVAFYADKVEILVS